MSEDFEVVKNFVFAVRDLDRDLALQIVKATGYGKMLKLQEHGTAEEWSGLVQTCALVLWLAKDQPPPFVPPPFRFRTGKRIDRSFESMRKAASLIEPYTQKARDLGCTVVFDEIICTESQMLELNRYWTELWDAK